MTTTAPKIESDRAALARATLADPSLAGIFADALEDHGDRRGVLLRRRWKRWLKEQAEWQPPIDSFVAECRADIDKMIAMIGDVTTHRYTLDKTTVLWRPGKGLSVSHGYTIPVASFKRYIRDRFFRPPDSA